MALSSYGTAVNRRKYSRKYFALVAYVPKNFYALNYPVITEKMRPNAYNQIHQLSNEYEDTDYDPYRSDYPAV